MESRSQVVLQRVRNILLLLLPWHWTYIFPFFYFIFMLIVSCSVESTSTATMQEKSLECRSPPTPAVRCIEY